MIPAQDILADAIARHARGEHGPAERLGRAVLALEPGNAEALQLVGLALRARGELAEAAQMLRRAAELRPDDPDLLNNLAATLAPLGEPDAAIAALEQAVALRPGSAAFHANLGNALAGAERKAAAEAAFGRAIALDPAMATAQRGLALLLHQREAHAEAVPHWRACLALQPGDYAAARSLLSCLLVLGRFAEAVEAGRHAAALEEDPVGLTDYATALHEAGRFAEARAVYARALAQAPDRPETRVNRSLLLLALGEFREGFAEQEHRLRVDNRRQPAIALPAWEGEPLAGRGVLAYPEQGLGDFLQFVRFLPRIAAAGGRVRLDVPDAMLRALAPFGGVALRPQEGETLDCKVSVMSLAHRFAITEADLPGRVPYLAAEPRLVARWRERIGTQGFRVGICWQGNPSVGWDWTRSIPLARFLPLARIPGVRLISLQQRYGLDQLAAVPPGVVETLWDRFPQEPDALVDSFAVMECLDLVVTSDTSVAHMAGALGRPVFLALRQVPDWRWMLGREDSPWYPSMRLFRQPAPGDWPAVFAAIAEAIDVRVRASAARG